MPGTPRPHGIAVFDAQGRLAFAAGTADEVRLRAILADPEWRAGLRARRLQPLEPQRDRRLLALLVPLATGEAVLLQDPPGDVLLGFVASVDFAWDVFHHLVSDKHDAMTVVDAQARVAWLSPVHEAFFGLAPGAAAGRPVTEVIENTRLPRVLGTGKAEAGEIQRMRGKERVVSRVPIRRGGAVVGAIGRVMFAGPAQVEALSRRVNALEREVAFYRQEAAALRGRALAAPAIIGEGAAVSRLRARIARVAPLDVPVLIQGESGTGKELVARALHGEGPRRAGPLVTVNAAALPATLVESELFGYAPGSFTGAERKGRKGRFEQADGGTLFLDEIGEMPPDTQAKLLRVLQERVVEPVGGDRPVPVDFRLIAATNRDLKAMVDAGTFRLDLFYRLSTVTLEVPRLADRRDDIAPLCRHFLHELGELHGRPALALEPEAADWLAAQPWPGNVRQLRQALERAVIFAEGPVLRRADLLDAAPADAPPAAPPPPVAAAPRLGEATARLEEAMIRDAIARAGGNKKAAAALLGISRSHLYRRLEAMEG
ncbi:sigma-54 interaction domain-containing protein [Roseococcus sp. DSY-14]|uniref:sigma-54 interaction domain-containing protein n=1 Tax=Roseococcus sp. DSY-14 TaxID=3369650 RepID=UPI00387A9C06